MDRSQQPRPRSRASVQFEPDNNRPCSPSTCRVSDCWSPTSDLERPVNARPPLGGLEKVIEYRPVPNGHGIELRRVTASVDGPVEHIQVVQPQPPRWIDFEPHPQMWQYHQPPAPPPPPVAPTFSSSRQALNGSQPCLMISEAADHDLGNACYRGQMYNDHPIMMERQRSLPRYHYYQQQQQQQQQQQHHEQQQQQHQSAAASLARNGRTNSMGRLDPMGQQPLNRRGRGSSSTPAGAAASSGSQPCLLVAQTVSNRRKKQAQEQKKSTTTTSKKKNNFQRSESFHQPQPHFFVNAQMEESVAGPQPLQPQQPPPAAPPSLSPLAVVRNKRASQANWEKVQRKNSMAAEAETNLVDSCVSQGLTPILGSAAASCTRRQSLEEDENTEDQMTEDSRVDDLLTLPPPPSPPCTCGKNLELPPTPPLEDMEAGNAPFRQQQQPANYHHPHCTDIETLQAQMEQMTGPNTCSANGTVGSRASRSRRGSSRATTADTIDVIDSGKEKTVNFANCVSPPSSNDPGFLGINNEAYPCDCCQLDESQFRRSYSQHQGPCGSLHFSERDYQQPLRSGSVGNGHCSNGIVIGGSSDKNSKISLPRRGSRSSKRQQQQQQQQQQRKKFFHAKFSEHERGISLEFGKFVALISISGVRFRRQHWCLLSILVLILVLCIAIGLPISSEAWPPSTPEARMAVVKQLLKEAPLIDGHNDLPWNIRKFVHNKLNTVNFTSNLKTENPWGTSQWSHTDLGRLSHGQVGGQLWVAYAPCGSQHKDAVQVTLEQIDLIKRFINQYPSHLRFVNDSTALVEAHADGKIASMISVESGHSIGTSLAVLRMFHRLGAISLTLTHNCNTPWADCSNVDKAGGKPEHNGLSSFGKTVIKELNRLGMIIDLSHSSHKTALDAIQASEAPVIFSHSSAFALCNSTRNVQDDVLKLVAKKNGMVMVNFFSYFLTCSNTSTVNDVVAHLNHIRTVAGVDHVGIGASYDGINATPRGLEDVSQYPELFATLLASGMWTIDDLKKLAGLNFLRVFREVERVSQILRPSQEPNEDHIDANSIQDHVSCRSVAKRDAGTPC